MNKLSYHGVPMESNMAKYPFLFGMSLSVSIILILPLASELVYIYQRVSQ